MCGTGRYTPAQRATFSRSPYRVILTHAETAPTAPLPLHLLSPASPASPALPHRPPTSPSHTSGQRPGKRKRQATARHTIFIATVISQRSSWHIFRVRVRRRSPPVAVTCPRPNRPTPLYNVQRLLFRPRPRDTDTSSKSEDPRPWPGGLGGGAIAAHSESLSYHCQCPSASASASAAAVYPHGPNQCQASGVPCQCLVSLTPALRLLVLLLLLLLLLLLTTFAILLLMMHQAC